MAGTLGHSQRKQGVLPKQNEREGETPYNGGARAMRTHLVGTVLLLSLVLTLRAWSGWDEWVGAYNRGDYATAVRELLLLAQGGNAGAQVNLGLMYYNGQGVPQDYTQAIQWFRRAADQGNANAQVNLGVMYRDGHGVLQDYALAMQWFRRAADQGNAYAQNHLGGMYANGQGVPQDYTQAMQCYRKAADQGDADAQSRLAYMYGTGQGVPQDYAQAAMWFRRAADQGDANAQLNLGWMYAAGQGMPQNFQQAYFWYSLAAAQGPQRWNPTDHEKSVRNRDRLAALLTPTQLAQAQAQSRAWQRHQGAPPGACGAGTEDCRPSANGPANTCN